MSAQLNLPSKPRLPLIPGFVVHNPKENHHLKHCFLRLDLDGADLCVEKDATDNEPMFNEKRILCFNAVTCESCTGGGEEQKRPVKILYFMEDKTIQVMEKRGNNSEKPIQVCIVKRQRIPCDQLEKDGHLTHHDLNVRSDVKILDRTYKITDCDNFTRLFLNKDGIAVPEPVENPENEHWTRENVWRSDKLQKKASAEVTKHQKFLNYENLRLKFDAYWDDRSSPFGELHYLVVVYYLSDDTIQITEINRSENPSLFYKRLKLPKKSEDVFAIYQKPNPMVLGAGSLETCVPDRSDHSSSNDVEFYTDADLRIGQILNVFGRQVVLTDCDDFTKEYYRNRFGIEDFKPIEKPKDPRWEPAEAEKSIPPYNGWGSHEDSESSCHSIVELKQPKRTTKSFVEMDNCKLRFRAQLLSKTEADNEREFILTYYLDDDTISVFEVGKKDLSLSGEFMKRAKFYLPHQCVFTSHRPESYKSQMLHIGANIDLNRYMFHLTDADEFTLNYMESHAAEYPVANIKLILEKIKGAFDTCLDWRGFLCKYLGEVPSKEALKPGTIKLCYSTTAMALRELLGKEISEHEILTFLRYFNADKPFKKTKVFNRSTVQSMIQRALATCLWDDIETVKNNIQVAKPMVRGGFMPKERLCSIIRGCRVPIGGVHLDYMFLVLRKDENGNIDVEDFLNFIDTKKYKAPPIEPTNPYSENDKKAFKSSERPQVVDWSAFLSEVGVDTGLDEGSN